MIVDPLPPTTNFGIWNEAVEFVDTEDNEPIDFSFYPDIRLEVFDPSSMSVVMTLTRASGQLTTPVPGIIEWYVDLRHVSGLRPGNYRANLTVRVDGPSDVWPLMRSFLPVVD
jgi:hypothetical protein